MYFMFFNSILPSILSDLYGDEDGKTKVESQSNKLYSKPWQFFYLDDYNVETINDGKKFRSAFHVKPLFFPQIIGSRGAVKSRIEKETRTIITVPKIGQTGDIVITGKQ